ncbi:MAG: pectinesterase family protein [Bacteroidales bacterium]|jgi:pectin methylesterase-like acyl-CoA thioesterase|nr:pectinesterase family protein [Bacteroidales bacterium]
MKKNLSVCIIICTLLLAHSNISQAKNYQKELTMALDGSGDCSTFSQAFEMMRAFMDYKVTLHVKNGVYHEKVILPSWLSNVEIIGENPDSTIIEWFDHANINNMGTFRTFTFRVDGNHITFRNLTIANNAPMLGQAVALHTQGDVLCFINCRFVGHQDTIFTGGEGTRLWFKDCYIEGTTDFIFGPAIVWFEHCTICSKSNSYITAASTPQRYAYGYVFNHCKIIAKADVEKVYLGRPWRPYAATVFMNCELGKHIRPEGWHNWRNPDNENTARYEEYNNTGAGANSSERVNWSKQLTKKEAKLITQDRVFSFKSENPFKTK